MTKFLSKIDFKIFLIFFFLFFLYEYGSPLVSFFTLSKSLDIPMSTLLQKPQVIKHFLRFPIYLFGYIYLFSSFVKNKNAFNFLKFMLVSHMIFKPLTILLALRMLQKNNLDLVSPATAFLWATIIFFVYLISYKYIIIHASKSKNPKND